MPKLDDGELRRFGCHVWNLLADPEELPPLAELAAASWSKRARTVSELNEGTRLNSGSALAIPRSLLSASANVGRATDSDPTCTSGIGKKYDPELPPSDPEAPPSQPWQCAQPQPGVFAGVLYRMHTPKQHWQLHSPQLARSYTLSCRWCGFSKLE